MTSQSETLAEAEGGGLWTGHAGINCRVLEMIRAIVAKIDRDRALVRMVPAPFRKCVWMAGVKMSSSSMASSSNLH